MATQQAEVTRSGETVRVGDTVIVRSGNRSRNRRDERYTVTKVARVWITVQREGGEGSGSWMPERRFRLDDQTDGSGYGAPDQFYTVEQWAKSERENAALAFLREQGIMVESGSPWRTRAAELATLISRGEFEPPPTPAAPSGQS
jgi:hypothetical protein